MSETGVEFDERGLVVAVAQDRLTGQVRMVAWMSRQALERTLLTGRATFFSRSRGCLWEKGETSGHTLNVHEVYADCDGDTLLLLVDPVGPSCHTGRPACFFRRVGSDGELVETKTEAGAFVQELESVIQARQASTSEKSYTRSLLEGGVERIAEKLREEAAELGMALATETSERVASEAADVLYHLLVALRLRGVAFRDVLQALAARAGTSGHAEKAARTSGKSRV